MVFGAFKRLTIVDLVTYAILAVPFVLLSLLLPEGAVIPDWAWAAATDACEPAARATSSARAARA